MVDETLEVVALIKKIKPKELNGLLNGVGGKLEPGEDPVAAMIREFREETGVYHNIWFYAGKVSFVLPDEEMFVYTTRSDKVFGVETMEDEEIVVHTVDEVLNGDLKLGPNVKQLLRMSLGCFYHSKRIPFHIYD